MAAPLSAETKALIDRPNFAHLATLMADGSPHSVPVWVGREGDRLVVCTSEGSLKGRNTRRDPRVALSIVDLHNPYEEVQLCGRVVERRPDPDLKIMDPVSHNHDGSARGWSGLPVRSSRLRRIFLASSASNSTATSTTTRSYRRECRPR